MNKELKKARYADQFIPCCLTCVCGYQDLDDDFICVKHKCKVYEIGICNDYIQETQ